MLKSVKENLETCSGPNLSCYVTKSGYSRFLEGRIICWKLPWLYVRPRCNSQCNCMYNLMKRVTYLSRVVWNSFPGIQDGLNWYCIPGVIQRQIYTEHSRNANKIIQDNIKAQNVLTGNHFIIVKLKNTLLFSRLWFICVCVRAVTRGERWRAS